MTEIKWNPAYEMILREDLPDIHAEGILLRHRKSGARVALVPCEDRNKVFYIAFRTPPADLTGVAHIIEHTVLCGSEKYPLRDPFIELVKGSLNTYLNATTYPDKTMYPVASTNDRDFRNLVDVYLDAVFHPNIYKEKNIFRQEGWSLRMEESGDPLTLSGVVYNEMKGAFSSPDEIMDRRVFTALFPDTPYSRESGGDPEFIPDLTYEAFLDFHRKYYHPSNSYIYFYGNFDIPEILEYLDRSYLSEYSFRAVDSEIALQEPFSEPVSDVFAYPVAQDETEEEKTYLSMNFVTGDRGDMTAQIAMDVLDYALFSMPGAPVRQALLDAEIGDDAYGAYSDGIAQPYFSVIAKNAEKEDFPRFKNIVFDTLRRVLAEGIDRDALMAGISSMEFQFREADYATWPKGLIYGIDMMDCWLYDDDAAFDTLKQLDAYAALRKHTVENDGYFEELLRTKFLENAFRADVILYPEKGLQEKNDRETEEMLANRKAAMSAEEINEIIRETTELREYQEKEESEEVLASLPSLHVSDLEKKALIMSNLPGTLSSTDGTKQVPCVFHETPTNGIGYTELLFKADKVPEEKLVYLSLLRSSLLNVDTDSRTYSELVNAVNCRTGGISCGITAYRDPADREGYRPYFVLRGRVLYEEIPFLYGCFAEILTGSRFEDTKRIGEILFELHSHQQMTLSGSGQSTALMRAMAAVSKESAFHDAVSGVAFYRALDDLYEHFEEKKEEIAENLRSLASDLFTAENLLISYTCGEKEENTAEEGSRILLDALAPKGKNTDSPGCLMNTIPEHREGYITGGQVQHVAMAGDFGKYGFAFSGAVQVLRHILNYGYLWDRIRIDGNAYGCGSSFSRNGFGSFMSFRDPHLASTLEVYRELPEYLASFDPGEEEMEKYIIGTVSSIDVPLTASLFGSVSLRMYLGGTTQEMLQQERDEVLSATAEDIRALAPLTKAIIEENAFCVVGSESSLHRHETLFESVRTLL